LTRPSSLPTLPRRFLFDGHILHETETPLEKEMEDDDVVDAWLQQIGGGE
jgi:hypothetical protein